MNTLQLLDTKDCILFEMRLADDEETYKAAYFLQKALQLKILDYMGRELEVIYYRPIKPF